VRVELSKKQLRSSTQQAALFFWLPLELHTAVGKVEDVVDVVWRQPLDPEQMAVQGSVSEARRYLSPEPIGRAPRQVRSIVGRAA
jgi:hypothetical protein